MNDPKSKIYNKCPICGGNDIRIHFTDKTSDPKDLLDWCIDCGWGTNPKRGIVDAFIFGSCVQQHYVKKIKGD